MKFDEGHLEADDNVKLTVDRKRGILKAKLVDPITKRVLCDVEYSKGNFISPILEHCRQEYVRAQDSAPIYGAMQLDMSITKTLIGYSNKRQVTGTFKWEADKSILDNFNKALSHGESNRIYRGLVRIQAKVKNGNFRFNRFYDARDSLFVQCYKCLSPVDNWHARKKFGEICELVPSALKDQVKIDNFNANYNVTCPNCGSKISHNVEISVEVPESISDRFRALNFWKNPFSIDTPEPTPIPNKPQKSESGQMGIVSAPTK